VFPQTHLQNNVVERKHRHVVDLGVKLLSQASLSLTYLGHSFLVVVYLINRVPIASLKFQNPFQYLLHKNPDYNFLKVFGCSRFPLLRPYNANKFDFRSHE